MEKSVSRITASVEEPARSDRPPGGRAAEGKQGQAPTSSWKQMAGPAEDVAFPGLGGSRAPGLLQTASGAWGRRGGNHPSPPGPTPTRPRGLRCFSRLPRGPRRVCGVTGWPRAPAPPSHLLHGQKLEQREDQVPVQEVRDAGGQVVLRHLARGKGRKRRRVTQRRAVRKRPGARVRTRVPGAS